MSAIPDLPVLRVHAEAGSLDARGHVRAGWLFDQIDREACAAGELITHGPVVIVSVNAFQLQVPVLAGETLWLSAECLRKGKTSLTLKLSATVPREGDVNVIVTEVIITCVAIQADGKSRVFDD
jgi:acyl-CoA thioesterase YciA